jgi:predicted SAM-dependent methyltransferase
MKLLSNFGRHSRSKKITNVLYEAKDGIALCNIGCGRRYHAHWINIDRNGNGRDVLPWDLRDGLPFPNDMCDVIYASHVLEHLERDAAKQFLKDCYRALKPIGIIRIVVPDLETVARLYLDRLKAARCGEPNAAEEYEWMTLELLDQLTRHRSGGEMLRSWSRDTLPEEDFIASRVGDEYQNARKHCRNRTVNDDTLISHDVGSFRLGGEPHLWMYDSYSLGHLLTSCGFHNVRACRADESAIPNFNDYNLDTNEFGVTRKPDSLFMEAQKV